MNLNLEESEIDEMSHNHIETIASLFQEYVSYLPQLSELTSISLSPESKAKVQSESKLVSILKVRMRNDCVILGASKAPHHSIPISFRFK